MTQKSEKVNYKPKRVKRHACHACRVWEVDFFRGICILLMVFDHLMFDFAFFPNWAQNFDELGDTFISRMSVKADAWWNWDLRISVRIIIVFTFVLLSGISCTFSRNNNKRFLKLAGAAAVLSAATYTADKLWELDVFIAFGILHVIAAALLIYIAAAKVYKNKYFFLTLGIAIVCIGLAIDFNNAPWADTFSLKTVIGLESFGADSYGIAPYAGVFLIGAYLGNLLYFDRKTLLPVLSGKWSKPVEFIGRNTIFVYIFHQPIILAVVLALSMFYGYKIF